MAGFASGRVRVLAATSVVEVGVDVANAACMVVEHAERFGLSTLHQLRGRVGRGAAQSYAFLVYGDDLTPEGVERLKIMKETTDGFRIAERDLALRGPGELLGRPAERVPEASAWPTSRATRTLLLVGARRGAADPRRGPGVPPPRARVDGEALAGASAVHGRRACWREAERCG